MNKVANRIRTRWQTLARWAQFTFITILVLVVVIRLALPFVVRAYVNRQLNQLPDYHAHVDKVEMHLYRGAYSIINVEILKTNGSVRVPFISMPQLDLAIDWDELFHGSVVGEVIAHKPLVNVIAVPSTTNGPAQVQSDWKQAVESLFPFDLNRFEIEDGDIRYRDFNSNPKVDIYITNFFATATNLTNTRDITQRLPAGLVAHGNTIGHGDMALELHMDPFAKNPTFKLQTSISNMDLVALNNFMRAYGNFDVADGTFQLYTEIAAADGRFQGYIKPIFQNLRIFDWRKERKKEILNIFWEALVAGTATILKNQPHNQLATKIPISGDFQKTNVALWATVGGVLRNAFVRALLPQIDRSVRMPDVEENRKPPA